MTNPAPDREWRWASLALLSGLALAGTHVPFAWAWGLPLPLAALLHLIASAPTARTAMARAFLAGLGFWSLHLLWLPASLALAFNGHAGLFWGLAALVWGLEAGAWALLAACTHWCAPLPWRLTGLALGWWGLEWAREWGPLAFPWGHLGYALIDTPLAQMARLGGVHLLSAVLLATAVALALGGTGRRVWLWPVAAIWVLACGYGATRPAPPPATERVFLVQGNINPLSKARDGLSDSTATHEALSRPLPADALVIWPEAAADADALKRSLLPNPVLTGAYRWPNSGGPVNSVLLMQNGQLLGSGQKTKLVPFGEFFPGRDALGFVYDPLFAALGLPGLATTPPSQAAQVMTLEGQRFGVLVCFDAAFPSLAADLVRQGAEVLVVLSNDAWFGWGWGRAQRLAMDQMRAIETGRSVLRATSTGISAVIDPLGRVVERLPSDRPGVLLARYARISER